MYPEILRVLRYLKASNIAPVLATNTFFLNDEISDLLLAIPDAEIRISLDAACKKTYRRIRGVDWFDQVMERIGGLAEAKKQKKSKLKIRINYVVMRINISEMVPLLKKLKHYDIYRYNFSRLRGDGLIEQKCESFKEIYNKYILQARAYARENRLRIDTVLL
jgi:MoaA/NifB/PqqE/SkfB family radical SAM enzyme